MNSLESYPLLSALRERRSRRFGLGMRMPEGPLAYQSGHAPTPLTEAEEAALIFAACGVTGYALADLCYSPKGGGNIMAGLAARTIASGDGLQTVSCVVTNDEATWLIRRPQEMPPTALPELIKLGKQGAFVELYRRCRVKIKDGRACPPVEPIFNINANAWSAHARGTTYFLPVNDLTFLYINGLLEILNDDTGVFIVDERNHFRPAGLKSFARSRGGHLHDHPNQGRLVTVRHLEQFVTEFVTVEQGMMLQNLGLMTQALGLGGFPNFANHEFGWFQALGFRMTKLPASRYLGANPLVALGMRWLRQDPMVPCVQGLERDGEVLLKPFCPPYYATMTEAVRAVAETKFGQNGVFRGRFASSAWKQHGPVTESVPAYSPECVAAASAYCEYIWRRYGRFPAYLPPYRTVLGFQACHVDADFYDRFYQPDVLSDTQRGVFARDVAKTHKSA